MSSIDNNSTYVQIYINYLISTTNCRLNTY